MGDKNIQTAVLADVLNPAHSIVNPATQPTAERTKAVEQLFIESYRYITDFCLSDSHLTFDDASMILEGVALSAYSGELTLDAFQQWVSDIITPTITFYGIRRQYARSVYAGAWSVIRNAVDLGFDDDTIPHIESLVWTWVLTDPKSPLVPGSGTGRISTRLYGKSRWLARAWKKTQLRARERFVDVDDLHKDEDGSMHGIRESHSLAA